MIRRRWIASAVVVLVVLSGGLVLGLRAGGSAQSTAFSTTTSTGGSGSTSTGGSGSTVTSAANTPTQPTVTVVTTPTTPADKLPGYGKPLVELGDGNTPEQFILGALYQTALEREGYRVALTRNIGTPQIALAALKQGSLELFPEYLNLWDSQIVGLNRRFGSLAAAYSAGATYADHHGARLLAPTPFSDTAGIAVTSQYAETNHINSLADLAAGPQVIFAAPLEFVTSPQGLPAVEQAYGIMPEYVQDVDFGSQWGWIESGNAQAAYTSTTDPQLLGPSYKLLADPAGVFGYGNVVPVTTASFLATEGPALLEAIERVDAALTMSAMRGLDYEVEVAGHDPGAVASEFLQGQSISQPVQYAPVPATTTTTETATTATTAP